MLGIWENVRRELKDLEKRLRDPKLRDRALQLLRRQPVVAYYSYGGRRYPIRGSTWARELLVQASW